MRTILFVVWVCSVGLTVYMQLKYAQTNYPRSWKRWLFIISFISGVIAAWLFLLGEVWYKILIMMFAFGTVNGLIFTFLFPYNMKNLYPERKPDDVNHNQ